MSRRRRIRRTLRQKWEVKAARLEAERIARLEALANHPIGTPSSKTLSRRQP